MRFDVITLFPEMITSALGESIIGRAQSSGCIELYAHQLRDWSKDKHRRVDDTPYGGGMGMLIRPDTVCDCHRDVLALAPEGRCRTVYMSPKGKVLTQRHAAELARLDRLIILCGHYEGIDRRAIDRVADEEISVGDYILTGGELPACILIDCISRMCEGVLPSAECYENESVACGTLEYPQYTRPEIYDGESVPSVLLGGNHAEIERWRRQAALELTLRNRPDLIY